MNTVFSPVFGVGTEEWFHITTFVWRTVEGGEKWGWGDLWPLWEANPHSPCVILLLLKCTKSWLCPAFLL